jgi:predicted amidohydrolase
LTDAPTLRVTLAQLTSADTHAANIAAVTQLARAAAAEGADLLALPEVAGLMQRDAERARAVVTTADADPYIAACRDFAREHGLWIATGSTPVLGPDGRFLNHADLIAPDGTVTASYDKIHLFDAFLEGRTPIGESRRFAPGTEAVLAPSPWGPIGLSICYDLRFPALYRAYAQAGAVLFLVPSAFTVPTGQAHWEALLRARAIENGAWVVAAAQVGDHADGRTTYGHAMIVSPWGEVRADLGGDGPGHVTLDLDMGAVAAARRQLPSLEHDRPFRLVEAPARPPG